MQSDSNTPLFVAIDIGKNVHCFAAYAGWQLQVVQAPQEVLSNRSGYEAFRQWLEEQLHADPAWRVIIGLEPTGIYHEAWSQALLRDFQGRVELRQINPLLVRRKRDQLTRGRKRKSDAQDDLALAHCLREEVGYPVRRLDPQGVRFSLWASAIRQTQQALARQSRRVLTQLDRLWPGMLLNVPAFQRAHPHLTPPEPLLRSQPLERRLLQILLEFAPNPYTWQGWEATQIQDFYHAHHLACGPKTSARLQAVLARLLLPDPAVAELLAEQVGSDFRTYRLLAGRLEELAQQAAQLVPASPAQVLTTFAGISPFLAAQYVAWVGDPWRFQHADQVWALAGFDLVQDDSGDRRRQGKLTKQGPGVFRGVLYTIGLTTSRHCPPLAQAKQRALQRGLHPVGATLHVAHRANRICFRLLRDQVPFDPDKLG